MDQPPFGSPWRVIIGEAEPLTLLGVFEQFADLYRWFVIKFQFTPRQVAAMELWELGALMRDDQESTGTPARPKRNLVAERLAFARGEGPEPLPDETPPDSAIFDIMQMVGGPGG